VCAVQVSTTRQERTAAAGAAPKPILRRIPCSEGRITLLVDSQASVNELLDSTKRIVLPDVGPISGVCVSFQELGGAEQISSFRDRQMEKKGSEARNFASGTSPAMTAITVVQARLRVEVAPGFHVRSKTLDQVENVVREAMGGNLRGILAVQLFADANGNVALNGLCTIWVGDIEESQPKFADALKKRLLEGQGATITNNIRTIASRDRPRSWPLRGTLRQAMNTAETTAAIVESFGVGQVRALIINRLLDDGHPVPWEARSGDDPMALSRLGPACPSTSERMDIRGVFTPDESAPSLQTLCAAIRALHESGVVEMYTTEIQGVEVCAISHSLYDCWQSDGAAMSMASD
jgi:hypothetical protein